MLRTAEEYRKCLELFNTAPVTAAPRVYVEPGLDLLNTYAQEGVGNGMDPAVLESKLAEFGLAGRVERVTSGPLISRFEVRLAKGLRLSQVRTVAEDLAVALQSDRIRIQAPIPSTSLVGIEVGNETLSTVGLRPVMEEARKSGYALPMAIGVDTTGCPKVVDLATMPHLLVAGQTGSGKSVGINAMILSLLYTKRPDECRIYMVDPKRVEMASYEGVPHVESITTEPTDFFWLFDELVKTMDRRYEMMSRLRVRNIASYNERMSHEPMPYIVAFIDEMADMMLTSGKQIERSIVRLAQLSRAVGIHLVMATQKPVVKVITGLIKSNMPSRISYQVASKTDSRVILDTNGAEKLLGRGDLLMTCPGMGEPQRFHGAWVSDEEISRVCDFLRG